MSSEIINIEEKEKMNKDLTDMFILLKTKINTTNESFKEVKQLIEHIDTTIDKQRSELDKQRIELDDHKKKLDKLKKLFLNYSIETRIDNVKIDNFDPSAILTSDQKKELNILCDFSVDTRWVLIYRASKNGFSAKNFHESCDGIPKTLTVVKTVNNYVFGGYTNEAWNQSGDYIYDKDAFIFSLINKNNSPIKINCCEPEKAVTSHSNSGPTFGDGHEFYISGYSNIKEQNVKLQSCSNVGKSYKHPLFSHNSHDAKTFLAGSFLFQTAEIEIFCRE